MIMASKAKRKGDAKQHNVGYGKPPARTQFQPGKSGNPNGRPKGALDHKSMLMRRLNEPITVTTPSGQTRRITKLDAVFSQLVNKAVRGDLGAIQKLLAILPLIETVQMRSTMDAAKARAELLAKLLQIKDRNIAVESGNK